MQEVLEAGKEGFGDCCSFIAPDIVKDFASGHRHPGGQMRGELKTPRVSFIKLCMITIISFY